MIHIISSRKTGLGLDDKSAWAEIVKLSAKPDILRDLKALVKNKVQSGDLVYLDISGFSSDELKKALAVLKKNASFWGIIDPKGSSDDPATFFFEGACDYIGPALVKKGLDKKRFAAAFSHALGDQSSAAAKGPPGTGKGSFAIYEETTEKRKPQKLPAGKFEGWKSLSAGITAPFFFLFVSLSEKSNLRLQLGETGFSAVKNRLRDLLQQSLHVADSLLWMETEGNSLFLVPPRAANGRAALEACLKLILNSRFISFEKLGLSAPVDFTFALHYGKTVFRAPGKTGDVISESVNYIFHLGSKKAETGRLTVSSDVPGEAFPKGLLDLFSPAGTFEGIPVCHSRRFVYK